MLNFVTVVYKIFCRGYSAPPLVGQLPSPGCDRLLFWLILRNISRSIFVIVIYTICCRGYSAPATAPPPPAPVNHATAIQCILQYMLYCELLYTCYLLTYC